ncbi:MAG TPA: PP2C family protein-serine/threonine phosphatase [Solirubrobacteraceae bacterium]|jgi:serine phosphatase RsbU (regulator of sigma subunit)|nr:PP2C family protein-serine/threonine phosphatase [Solirubrobacteraceae bacterium]
MSAPATDPPVGEVVDDDVESRPGAVAPPRNAAWWHPSRVTAMTFAIGIVVTAALAVIALVLYNNNENRLLHLRVRELGLVLEGAVPATETPVAAAAAVADATNGNAAKLRAFIAPEMVPRGRFTSVSLWPLGRPGPLRPSVVIGAQPQVLSLPASARAGIARSIRQDPLTIVNLLAAAHPAIGYVYSQPGATHGFAVYAETPLPASRRSRLEGNTGFNDLNYAIYLGRSSALPDLLVTNIHRFPIRSRHASESIPFGDTALTLVVTPAQSLGGTFFESLPWVIAVVGLLLSLAAALTADRLTRRRLHAEQLAAVLDRVAEQNRQMYAEQRTIAQSLQHALLPETLASPPGLQASARYVPATSGIDVGGDWYDVVEVDGGAVLLIVGDVSGHGLRAATTMASLRYAALAYAAQDSDPQRLLARLSDLAGNQDHAYFATVLCCRIEVAAHQITLASAGHPGPLLIDAGGSRFLEVEAGVPVGVQRRDPYTAATTAVGAGATLIAFTDGLVERRGEVLDTGLERLRRAAAADGDRSLDTLVGGLARDLTADGHHDDTAIVAIRWEV